MNLNRLYQPTPSPQATEVRQPATETDLPSQLRQAQSHAEHWRCETAKMDQIARDALDKLAAKKLKAQRHKADAQALKEEVDVWRARYKEASTAQADSLRSKAELDSRSDRLQKELSSAQDRLQKERAELASVRSRLQELEAQLPGIQQRLTQGGTAVRRLQELEPQLQGRAKLLEASEAQAKQLQAKVKALEAFEAQARQLQSKVKALEASEAQAKHLQAKVKALEESEAQAKQLLTKGKQVLQAKVKTLEASEAQAKQLLTKGKQVDDKNPDRLELVAVKEKLRAAAHEASAKGAAVLACKDMLARAEQVLQTCSQLHAAREGPSELAEALAETTARIGSFLRSP
jgi:chromosome segregation ATPase